MDDDTIKKFWKRVLKSNTCWEWQGSFNTRTKSFPVLKIGKPSISARKISLQIHGIAFNERERILPLICKNYKCVNPDHLVIGNEARFWSKVQKLSDINECWVWLGSFDKDMYGQFDLFKDGIISKTKAHIYSWELYNERKAPKNIGSVICHSCDHPWCVNPDHLSLGSIQDNINDKVNKGRQARGTTHHSNKLSETQVKEIREIYAQSNTSTYKLAKIYGMSQSTIGAIIRRKIWKHV